MFLRNIKAFTATLLLTTAVSTFAQNIVTVPIETKENALVLQTDNEGHLGIIYFGKKLSQNSEYAM